jgi:hypothetical protein
VRLYLEPELKKETFMPKTLRLSLLLAILTAGFSLVGCKKDEPVKDSAATIAADASKNAAPATAPANIPPQMAESLNNPNTPPEVKAKIRAQLGIK